MQPGQLELPTLTRRGSYFRAGQVPAESRWPRCGDGGLPIEPMSSRSDCVKPPRSNGRSRRYVSSGRARKAPRQTQPAIAAFTIISSICRLAGARGNASCRRSIAFLLAGALAAGIFFDAVTAVEREIRTLADAFYADWRWAQNQGATLTHG